MKKTLLLLLLVLVQVTARAQGYAGHEQAAGFIELMVQEHGFEQQQIEQFLADARPRQAILDAISRPAERVRPWHEYRKIFLTEKRLQQGLKFWQQNARALAGAEQQYGVAAEYIVAIIGVETMYGANTGSYRVLDALATLGFDYPPRQDFFRRQLVEFLLLAREHQLEPGSLTGSYAGAMGLPQFMPGSYRAYAVDFNNDGHIDIWQDAEDAIGSVANYFAVHGWRSGEPVVRQLQDGEQAADEEQGISFSLETETGLQHWFGLPNFVTITRYNRSNMYAMAVHQLAQQLKAAHETAENE